MFTTKGEKISLGDLVSSPGKAPATVKYIGDTGFAPGIWLGLELPDDCMIVSPFLSLCYVLSLMD